MLAHTLVEAPEIRGFIFMWTNKVCGWMCISIKLTNKSVFSLFIAFQFYIGLVRGTPILVSVFSPLVKVAINNCFLQFYSPIFWMWLFSSSLFYYLILFIFLNFLCLYSIVQRDTSTMCGANYLMKFITSE